MIIPEKCQHGGYNFSLGTRKSTASRSGYSGLPGHVYRNNYLIDSPGERLVPLHALRLQYIYVMNAVAHMMSASPFSEPRTAASIKDISRDKEKFTSKVKCSSIKGYHNKDNPVKSEFQAAVEEMASSAENGSTAARRCDIFLSISLISHTDPGPLPSLHLLLTESPGSLCVSIRKSHKTSEIRKGRYHFLGQ